MCGDHFNRSSTGVQRMGSPPHVRGPLNILSSYQGLNGITPACAGTTKVFEYMYAFLWDHPRMCGDHSLYPHSRRRRAGSPPHVRGPLVIGTRPPMWQGITPACAGTTDIISASSPVCRDHPRMCGDHLTCILLPVGLQGSPPHVRGPHGG